MVFEIGYLADFKIFFVGILIYVIIFSLLTKLKLFGEDKNTSALIAIVSTIIVSFTGVLTYAVTYAITWFAVILFLFFLIFVLMSFLGIEISEVGNIFKSNSKIVLIVFLVIFSVIFLKSFFVLNNTFDTSNPQNDSYAVNTQANTGVDDISGESSFWDNFSFDMNSDMVSSALFLLIIGVFVMLIG